VPAPSAFCETVASVTGCETGLVNHIVQGMACSMRQQQKTDAPLLLTELALELEYCAKAFAGAVKTEELVLDELAEFASTRFGHLGVREIREAFRLAAAGELGDINLRAYFGNFTVVMLGDILRAYDRYRQRIVASVTRLEQEHLQQTEEEKRKASWDYEAWEGKRLAQLKGLLDPDLEKVTALDYDMLDRRGLIKLPVAEKRRLVDQAGLHLQAELHLRLQQAPFGEQLTLRALLERIGTGQADTDFEGRKVNYAKRLAVLEWIEREGQNEI
jgi:hypothetical protein